MNYFKTKKLFLVGLLGILVLVFLDCGLSNDVDPPAIDPPAMSDSLSVDVTIKASRATVTAFLFRPQHTDTSFECDGDNNRFYLFTSATEMANMTQVKILNKVVTGGASEANGFYSRGSITCNTERSRDLGAADLVTDRTAPRYYYAFYGDSSALGDASKVSSVVSGVINILYNDLDTLYPDSVVSIFQNTCSCHSGFNIGDQGTGATTKNVNGKAPYFGEISNLLGEPSYVKSGASAEEGVYRIVVGDTAKSVLWGRISGTDFGSQMPVRGGLTDIQRQTLGDWIRNGLQDREGNAITK